MKHDGWEVKKLGEICETITKGITPKTIGYDFTDSGINFIKVESINELGCFITENFTHISNECHKALMRSQLEEYDMLFSIAGALGRTAIVDKSILPANTNQALSIIRLKEKNVRFLYYLQYYLKSDRIKNYIDSIKVGVAQMNLSLGQLKEFPIIIPPLPEQFRIVEELDQLSNIIEKKRQQLSELDNLVQSIFYDMFGDPVTNEKGWEVKKLGEVCVDIIRGPFGSALKKDYFVPKGGDTYKVYEQKHAIQKDVSLGAYYISSDRYKSMMRFTVYENDIIMSCSGTIGEMFIIPNNAEVGIINQALLLFRISTCINQTFFLNVMNAVKSSMETKGAGIKNIGSVKYIKQIDISLPPLNIQQLFAQKIEAIEKEKELIKQSIKETEELFNSRMDYYFG